MRILIAAAALFVAPALADEGAAGPSQIVLHQHGHGWLLTDDKGKALYTYDKDVDPRKSACDSACAQQWPPLLVTQDGDKARGEWSIVLRDDGASKQWAYRGKPLYYYSLDGTPGEVRGDGVGNQWHQGFKSIPLPPGIGVQRTLIGYVLADQKSLTLYSFDQDKPDGSGCDAACTRTWMPVLAPLVAHGVADWTVNTRKDGSRQWAYKGNPVYRYSGDVHVRETLGDKAAKGWHAIVLEPTLPIPTWITIQESDAGEVLADKDGRTLYTFDPTARRRPPPGGGSVTMPVFDKPEDWAPLLAAGDENPIGNWSVVEREGRKQWAYKGLLLYVNNRDKNPGELYGWRGGGRARLRPMLRSGTL